MAMTLSDGAWVPARHLMAIDREVSRAVMGYGPRILVIEAPPRHGKSEYTSKYLPTWLAAIQPNKNTILSSYEASFARSWGQKARDLVNEHSKTLGVSVSRSQSAANDWGIQGHSGGMKTAGAGGPLTGKGAHVFICDDLIKNHEEALSPTVRASHWDWWQSTASTRIEPGGLAILMGTRWHAEDLQGKVLTAAETGEGPPVLRIKLPAIAEDGDWLGRAPGDPLWPERWSLEVLHQRRKALDAYWWGSLYQQGPGRHGSTEWPDDYWGDHLWVNEMPASFERGAIGVDPSKGKNAKKGDYSSIEFAGVSKGLIYVDGTIRRRPSEQIVADGLDHATKYSGSLHGFGVEVNQFQELLVGMFETQREERKLPPLPVCEITNTVNKKLRISRLGPYFNGRKIRLLDTPDNRLLIEQCKQFSMREISGVHDDGPDALEMALRTLIETHGGEVRDDGLGDSLVSMD